MYGVGAWALPLLRNLTNLVFGRQRRPQAHARFPHQICSHLGPQEDKNTYDMLDEFIDLIKVILIKMVAFYAEIPFDRLGKECALSALVSATLFAWRRVGYSALTLGLKEVLNFAPRLAGVGL